LALAGRDDAGAVRPHQPARLVFQEAHGPGHVQDGDALGDGDDYGNPGVGGLHDSVGGGRWRDEDHGGVRPGPAYGLGDRVEEWKTFLGSAALARDDAANDLGAVVAALSGVEGAGLAQALAEDARVFIDQDAHE